MGVAVCGRGGVMDKDIEMTETDSLGIVGGIGMNKQKDYYRWRNLNDIC